MRGRNEGPLTDSRHLATLQRRHSNQPVGPFRCRPALFFYPVSDHGALHGPRRLRGVELTVALFDAASPSVPRDGHTNMVRASPLARNGDFLLLLAVCHGNALVTAG